MSTLEAQRIRRRYGFPFDRYVSTVARNELPLGAIGPDSSEVLLEPGRVPELGKVKRRHGASQAGVSAAGILEMVVADATMRGLEVFELPTLVSGDGYPVLCVLWADESKRYGQLWLQDGSASYTLGEEFSTTHWPVAASTGGNIKMPPMPYDGNGATGYMRFASEQARRRTVAGTRRRVGIGSFEYGGGYYSCPWKWGREYNTSPSAGTNFNVFYPGGHVMPLTPPSFPSGSYPTRKSTAAPWGEGDKFFACYTFEWEDGTESMPFIPRDINATLTTGLGLVTVPDDADGTAEYFDYIPWRLVAVGPPGVKRRKLYRSKKKTKTQITAGDWPSIDELFLCGVIENNEQTAYNDPRGNDASLYDNPLLRMDQVWPNRYRYGAVFEQRHIVGYLRPNPCAIVLAISGVTTSRDMVGYAFDATPGAAAHAYRVTLAAGTLNLVLRYISPMPDGAPGDVTINLTSAKTLRDIVDEINATAVGGAAKEWCAQLVPGVSYDASAINLAPTHVTVANVTITNGSATVTATGTDPWADVAEGMVIQDTTNFAAATYVKTKNFTAGVCVSLTMSAAATATPAVGNAAFYADTGDDALVTDGTYGNVRVFNNTLPGIIAFRQSYLDDLDDPRKRDVQVTSAGTDQKPYAANLFHASPGGRHTVDAAAGILMGIGPLNQGCVLWYSKQTHLLRNVRSAGTGEDLDYHVFPLDFAHGCLSPYSVVQGNGWAGCLRDDGFFVTDGQRSAILSGDVFDPVSGRGDWNYEATKCAAAAQADTNDYKFFAHFADGRLWVNFRTAASAWATMCYDCSPSVEATGIAQVLKPDGTPYGWSPPCHYSYVSRNAGCSGAIGSVRKSDGLHLYQTDDRNSLTRCGQVQEFESTGTWTDGPTDTVTYTIHTVTDMLGGMFKSALSNLITFLYKLTTGSGGTATVKVYRNQQRTAESTINLPRTTGDFFSRKAVPVPLKARSAGEVVELKITGGDSVSDEAFELSGIETEANVLDSRT